MARLYHRNVGLDKNIYMFAFAVILDKVYFSVDKLFFSFFVREL